MTAPTDFGSWLFQLRKSLGLSRQAVVERAGEGISQQYIHFIETGRATNIGSDKLIALSKGIGVPLAVIQQALFEKSPPEIPVIGRSAAGTAIRSASEEYQNDWIPYHPQRPNLFGLEVVGDSMAPRIEHGDILFAQSIPHPDSINAFAASDQFINGGVYVFTYQHKTTCKYLIQRPDAKDTLWLVAENPQLFADIPWEESYSLLGRVVEVRKTQSLIRPISQ